MQPQIRPVQFEIISSDTVADIQDRVNRRLKDGWVFHGDTKVVHESSQTRYVQAMARIEIVMPSQMSDGPGPGSGLFIPQR